VNSLQGRVTSRPAPKVFICYRREESAPHAGRLYDAMVDRFGEGNVFMDVDLAPGVDFVTRITEVVAACRVLIVVMGPTWATLEDEQGEVRIADPEDFVRLEVDTGLRRPEVTPIPVLVRGARMPRREELPAEIQSISRRNALELSEVRWRDDVARLNGTLDELLVDGTRTDTTIVETESDRPGGRLVLEGLLVAGAAAIAARTIGNLIPDSHETARALTSVVARRLETWALVGAALAVWLGRRTGSPDLLRLAVLGLLVGALGGALGGALWAIPVLTPNPDLSTQVANRIEVGSLAVTGGFIGALLGMLWRPPHLGMGLAGGFLAGAATQVIFNASGWDISSNSETVLSFGIAAAVIAAVTLCVLVGLGSKRPAAALA
jgi:hypothetical protein